MSQVAAEARKKTDRKFSDAELDESLTMMRVASSHFYANATQSHCHAFIEFAGFMNEFINMCQAARDNGVDFTMGTAHTGKDVFQMQSYQAKYVGEKFECIFATAFRKDPALIAAFCKQAFGVEVEVK